MHQVTSQNKYIHQFLRQCKNTCRKNTKRQSQQLSLRLLYVQHKKVINYNAIKQIHQLLLMLPA